MGVKTNNMKRLFERYGIHTVNDLIKTIGGLLIMSLFIFAVLTAFFYFFTNNDANAELFFEMAIWNFFALMIVFFLEK